MRQNALVLIVSVFAVLSVGLPVAAEPTYRGPNRCFEQREDLPPNANHEEEWISWFVRNIYMGGCPQLVSDFQRYGASVGAATLNDYTTQIQGYARSFWNDLDSRTDFYRQQFPPNSLNVSARTIEWPEHNIAITVERRNGRTRYSGLRALNVQFEDEPRIGSLLRPLLRNPRGGRGDGANAPDARPQHTRSGLSFDQIRRIFRNPAEIQAQYRDRLTTIGNRNYTEHALQQMESAERRIPPTAVDAAIRNGTASISRTHSDRVEFFLQGGGRAGAPGIKAIVDENGVVITVIRQTSRP